MLVALDQSTLVSRGPDLSKALPELFEARNYLVVFVAYSSTCYPSFFSPAGHYRRGLLWRLRRLCAANRLVILLK